MWKKKENTVYRGTAEETEQKKFLRVKEKVRNLPKTNEAGPSTSSPRQTQTEEDRTESEILEVAETEIMSSDSGNTIPVPTKKFKR